LGDGGKLLDEVLSDTIPMYGRMIHTGVPGEKGESQKYDVHGKVCLFCCFCERGLCGKS